MIDLTSKVVLVTGGARGIGAAAVRAMGGAGAEVIIHFARNRAAAEALASELPQGRTHLVAGDLADPVATEAVWNDAVAWKGRIDVLVNNAGIYEAADPDGDLDAFLASWDRTLRVNLTAIAQLCRLGVPHFRERGEGTIINVASRSSFRGDDYDRMNYAASKGGLIALTRSIARKCAPWGVLAYAVAPGFVATEMVDQIIAQDGLGDMAADIPLGEIAPASDVGNTIASE
jgi:3-oxoacyl-[acyl-carrier protein] reductase